jgi:hypothetical protein
MIHPVPQADPDFSCTASNMFEHAQVLFFTSQLYAFIRTSSLLQRPLLMDLRTPFRAERGASSAADSSDMSSSLEPLSYPERDLKTQTQSVAQTLRLQTDITQCVRKVDVHLGYGTFRFRPASTLVDITSTNFYKCTAIFRTRCIVREDNGCTTGVRCPTRYGTYRRCDHRPVQSPPNP